MRLVRRRARGRLLSRRTEQWPTRFLLTPVCSLGCCHERRLLRSAVPRRAKAEALRHRRLALDAAETAAARAKALADPTRLMLAVALRDADGELCVCDLSWVAERSEKLVSHHVRALRAG